MPGRPEGYSVTISDPFLVGLKCPINDHPPAQRALYLSGPAFVEIISGNSRLITPELRTQVFQRFGPIGLNPLEASARCYSFCVISRNLNA